MEAMEVIVAKNVEALLDDLDSTRMILESGYNWREKYRTEIFRQWRSMSLPRRLYWTLRGRRPV